MGYDYLFDGFFKFDSVESHITGATETKRAYIAADPQDLKAIAAARMIFFHFDLVVNEKL